MVDCLLFCFQAEDGRRVSHYLLEVRRLLFRSFSPKLSLRHAFAGDWVAELSLATATRFPTVGELFQGSPDGDGSFNEDSFDPDLKPEKSRDANLLLPHAVGPVTLTGSVFYQRVKNAIFSFIGFNQNGVSTSSFKNIDATRQYGSEMIAGAREWPVEGLDIEIGRASCRERVCQYV